MEEKPNYYAIIPAEVRYDKRLKPIARLLYGEITCLSNKEGYCFASNKYFADLYDCTPRAIINYLNDLQEYGYITTTIENNFQRKIYLTSARGYENSFTGGSENSFTGGSENSFTHNNINNNNINNNRLIDYNKFNLEKIFEEKQIFISAETEKLMPEKSKKIFLDLQAVITEMYNQQTYKKYLDDVTYDDLINVYDRYEKYKRQVKNPYTYMCRCLVEICRKRMTA